MTQDRDRESNEDRLDRIEAALDRQVAVNADLRTSVETLKLTADALLQVATIHQQNFERLTTELNADRVEWRAQIERIWEYLEQRGNGRE